MSGKNVRFIPQYVAIELLNAVLNTRAIVSEAAMTGFNWKDGDWADRLFKNQASLSKAISQADGKE